MLKPTSTCLRRLGLRGPAMVVDEERARANIRAMAVKARRGGVRLRPHFKTHQSDGVGRWFADEGVAAITVSSLDMAEYFAASGWSDITVAILCNPLELPRADTLAHEMSARGGRLGLTVDDPGVARRIGEVLTAPADIWLKVDTGYGRTGVPWAQTDRLAAVLAAVDGSPRVAGLLAHAGHGYAVRGRDALARLYRETVDRLAQARQGLGRPDLLLSVGDTPGCAASERLDGADEIRPGNFVFHDLMQLQIGSCDEAQLAVAAVCPVLGVYPDRGELVLHGGAVHLAKEALREDDGTLIYGRLGTLDLRAGAPTLGRVLNWAPLVSLSQEHGVVAVRGEFAQLGEDIAPGDLVLVWPIHACLTCDLHRGYLTLAGRNVSKR